MTRIARGYAHIVDREVVHVRVWYPDAVYEDHDWDKLPKVGLQFVGLEFRDGTKRGMMGDNYFFRWDSGQGVVYGSTDHVGDLDKYKGAQVIKGKWTPDPLFAAIEAEYVAWASAPQEPCSDCPSL